MNFVWGKRGESISASERYWSARKKKRQKYRDEAESASKASFCQFQIISHIPFQLDRDGGSLRKVTL